MACLPAEKALLEAELAKLKTTYANLIDAQSTAFTTGIKSYTFDSGSGKQSTVRMTPGEFEIARRNVMSRIREIERQLSCTTGPTIFNMDRLGGM